MFNLVRCEADGLTIGVGQDEPATVIDTVEKAAAGFTVQVDFDMPGRTP
jgi:hypothetical protein